MRALFGAFSLFALASIACGEEPRFEDIYVHIAGTSTWSRGLSDGAPILFLNRCANGCTVAPSGADDSRTDHSSIVSSTVTMAAFPWGDDTWEKTVQCVQKKFKAFELIVTDVDPGSAPHFESYVSGRPEDVGLPPSVGGVGSLMCGGPIENATNFAFADAIGDRVNALCVTIAHEAGHNFSLEHEYLCNDPMTYLAACGEQEWQRVDAECGEHQPRDCMCGSLFQNSYLSLLDSFGPRVTPILSPPHVEIISPDGLSVIDEARFDVFIDAKDDVAVARVEATIDRVSIGTSTLAPYVFRAPDGLLDGRHVLFARAYDNDGLTDTTTKTIYLEVRPPAPARDAAMPDALEPEPEPDAGLGDAGVAPPSTEDGCSCAETNATRAGAMPLLVLAMLVLALSRRRRAWLALLFICACSGGDDLIYAGASAKFDPAPGTELAFEDIVLGRSTAAPRIISVKSLGPGVLRLDPPPFIEGDGFFVSSAPKELAPGASGEIFVRFDATAPGQDGASLVVKSNDRTQPEVRWPLSGRARDPCVLALSPPHTRFEVGDTHAITIRAASTYQCTITRLTTDTTLWEWVDIPSLPAVIPAGQEISISLKHYARTLEPGLPIRHVLVRESEGTEAFVSIEGQPAAWNCFEAYPDKVEFPDSALGIPVRKRVVVTNRCDTRVHVLSAFTTLGAYFFQAESTNLPLGVDPFDQGSVWVDYLPFSDLGDVGILALNTDDALHARLEIDLTGKGIYPRAGSIPSVDFGNVSWQNPRPVDQTSECVSRTRIAPIFSSGVADLLVKSIAVDPAGDHLYSVTGASIGGVRVDHTQPIVVPAGNELDIALTLRPTRLDPALHASKLIVEHTALDQHAIIALTGRGIAPAAITDVFTVPRDPKLDVLLVIDDSLSMKMAAEQLSNAMLGFLDALEVAHADYQLAVTTTDSRTVNAGWFRQCGNDPFILSDEYSDPADRARILPCMMYTGNRGRQAPSGIGAAMRAIEHAVEPLDPLFEPSANYGFVRSDSKLVLIMMSNDEDQSLEPPVLAAGYFEAIKGRADLVQAHALAGSPLVPCANGTPYVQPGVRYEELAGETGGTFGDICAPDLAPAIDAIAASALKPIDTFTLSSAADAASVRVEIDNVAVPRDAIDGFTFDAATNSITLHGNAFPTSLPATVNVTYGSSCGGGG